jgi:hypothetical protein
MSALLLWLLLTPPEAAPAAPAVGSDNKVAVSFKTAKTRPKLEACLYDELSDLGEATFMQSEAETILMIRNGDGPPLLVEIAPPTVQITTKASADVKTRVKHCI